MLYNLFENRDFVSVFAVALLAEGVDRNSFAEVEQVMNLQSPSSRRAWIEIASAVSKPIPYWSPSSRRAWIEIDMFIGSNDDPAVALLAEGVDRNKTWR